MSVLMVLRVTGDTDAFRRYVQEHPDELRAISEDAKGRGCRSHRFGVGDGEVIVIDEWDSAESFQRFFDGNEAIAEVMRAAGAQGEPQVSFADAIQTADQF